ncbi:MAG: DUF423 domain-containing protein [Wenzhouxiangellaceae bacterium]|nr:DUF423 domain-containing protein [Wenzhouxiangellaceae bacterium]
MLLPVVRARSPIIVTSCRVGRLRYHQVGAILAVMLALAGMVTGEEALRRALARAGWLFVAGTLLFSFSIYAAALAGMRALTWVTPVGGIAFMLAWLELALAARYLTRPGPRQDATRTKSERRDR